MGLSSASVKANKATDSIWVLSVHVTANTFSSVNLRAHTYNRLKTKRFRIKPLLKLVMYKVVLCYKY